MSLDLILLGMGPDGHTCSLFPDHKLLDETKRDVASLTDSPKPPPARITLTFPVLNRAKNVVFVATGADKQAILHKVVETSGRLPAQQVKNAKWFVDEVAAAKLTRPSL